MRVRGVVGCRCIDCKVFVMLSPGDLWFYDLMREKQELNERGIVWNMYVWSVWKLMVIIKKDRQIKKFVRVY